MRIKCWGSRGSICVSGQQYTKYGGDTTCFEIQANSGEVVIIDAGTGIRRLGKSLVQKKIKTCYLLLTHTHWDHIIGLPFFHSLPDSGTTVHIQDRTFAGLTTKQVIDRVMCMPFFPVGLKAYNADIRFDSSLNNRFSIGSLDIETILTSHSQDSMGYRFTENGKTFVFLTDNELGYTHPQGRSVKEYIAFSKDADLLFHDTEYTDDEYLNRTGWGHSRLSDVLDLSVKASVGQLGLIHINQDRTDDQVDAMVDQCRQFFNNNHLSTSCYAVAADFEIFL
ncbi:MBL fold metallo-hydrolase [Desulfobacter postgatei]|jgi:phosphoribosyl 1,2-cyclic phosphodiesterase|uniref:MBL fold metallo-hydrolase n=1 Tax=Desulfobacter postgatei TaxID=2293 RepID=UPI002A367F6C|nr:MBL fold metallo-hydrolase [Desulfobacter postgatei]MDX9965042.1 MBL fold metallo-hydrolase [Desulfobacter postgatei]